jgi:DNA-binding PadR family transcriptional regulator
MSEGRWRDGPEGWGPGDEGPGWRRHQRRSMGGPGFPGRRGFPPMPPMGPPMGPHVPGMGMWFGGPGARRARGPRARRGDVRAAALALLAEEPLNGYQIIQAIGERSDGVWRPSPGSVYPALQQLEDEGLVRAESGEGGRRVYQLTDEGRSYVEAHPDEVEAPWDVVAGSVGNTALELRSLVGQVGVAAFQVLSAGTDGQVAQARQVLTDARKSLYRLLAADDDETTSATGATGAPETPGTTGTAGTPGTTD